MSPLGDLVAVQWTAYCSSRSGVNRLAAIGHGLLPSERTTMLGVGRRASPPVMWLESAPSALRTAASPGSSRSSTTTVPWGSARTTAEVPPSALPDERPGLCLRLLASGQEVGASGHPRGAQLHVAAVARVGADHHPDAADRGHLRRQLQLGASQPLAVGEGHGVDAPAQVAGLDHRPGPGRAGGARQWPADVLEAVLRLRLGEQPEVEHAEAERLQHVVVLHRPLDRHAPTCVTSFVSTSRWCPIPSGSRTPRTRWTWPSVCPPTPRVTR